MKFLPVRVPMISITRAHIRARSHKRLGFTLIEVMVAVSIFAILAILSWRGLDTLVQGRSRIADAQQKGSELQRVIAQWERDMQFLASTLSTPNLYATNDGITLIRKVPAPVKQSNQRGDAGAMSNDSFSTGLYYQQVRYFVDPEKTLWREPSIPLSAALLNAAATSDQASRPTPKVFVAQGRQALLHGIDKFSVTVFLNNTWQTLLFIQNNDSSNDSSSASDKATTANTQGQLNTQLAPLIYGGVRLEMAVKGKNYSKLFLTTP